MQTRLLIISLGALLMTACELKRLDEKVVSNDDIEVHWWETSAITSSQGHVEVIKGDEVRSIARLFHGGIHDVVIHQDTIVLTKDIVGLVDFVKDSVFGYWIMLDSLNPENAWISGQWNGVISNSCLDTVEKASADSIYLRFDIDGHVVMTKSQAQPNFETTYYMTEDGVVFQSLFGSAEKRLNFVPGDYDDTLELGVNEGDCYHLFTIVHTDSPIPLDQ